MSIIGGPHPYAYCIVYRVVVDIAFLLVEASNNDSEENARSSMYAEWRKHSATVRNKLKLSKDYSEWTNKPGIRLEGVPSCPRLQSLINTAWGARLRKGPSQITAIARKDYWVDLNKPVQRLPWRETGGCLYTHAVWYSFEHDCVIDGHDFLKMMGAPAGSTPHTSFSNHLLRDLGGEAYSIPIITAFTYSLYLNPYGPWWRELELLDQPSN